MTFSSIAGVKRRVWVWPIVATLLLAPTMAGAGVVEDAVTATDYVPDQYIAAFDNAVLPGLAPIGPPPAITGNADLDARIRQMAEARGYKRRAEPNRPLVEVEGQLLQPEAAAGWETLRADAAAAGHTIWITSGYRKVSTQVWFLQTRIVNNSDAAIDHALSTVAAPGYSRHHTGYTIDIKSSTAEGFAFRNSPAYAWLAADNFANAKVHGWLPSYPEGASDSGPVPEPWEFVWIGATNIICGDYHTSVINPFCDLVDSSLAPDIHWLADEGISAGCRLGRFCPTGVLSRSQAATMIWRVAGAPDPLRDPPFFVDVPIGAYFYVPVSWMVSKSYTTGTSPSTYSPDRATTRAEFVTLLWMLADSPTAARPSPFTDVEADTIAADAIAWAAEVEVTRGTSATTFSPHRPTSRAEASAFIHRFSTLGLLG